MSFKVGDRVVFIGLNRDKSPESAADFGEVLSTPDDGGNILNVYWDHNMSQTCLESSLVLESVYNSELYQLLHKKEPSPQ